MKKKILSIILVLSILCAFVPVIAQAATSGTCGDNLTWTLDDNGTLTISGEGAMTDWGYYADVPWYSIRSSIKNVIIGNSVTSICDEAFCGCSSLESVVIPDSVTSIGEEAFYYCSSLTSVYISDLASYLNIKFVSSDSNPMYYAKKLYLNNKRVAGTVIIPDGVTQIPYCAFDGCDGITSITIPDSVTSIGGGAFSSCSSLTSVTIPYSVTSIGGGAFSSCSSLTSVTIPYSVTSIGDRAFYKCSSLGSVTIPDSVTSIGEYAFYKCSSLTSVTIPDSVTSICDEAFYYCSRLTSVTIPYSVTSIGEEAFYYCSSLTSVTIPDSVTSIGNSAFYGCSSLKEITIPSSITNIGNYAFGNCSGLTTIYYNAPKVFSNIFSYSNSMLAVLGDNVISIDTNAFRGCKELKKIFIPKSMTEIEKDAFSDCSNLTVVEYGGSLSDWEGMYVGANENLTNAAIHYNSFAENAVLTDLDYLTYTKNDDNTITITACNPAVTNINIPKKIDGLTVTAIGSQTLYNCNKLTTITIPNSIKSIGSSAFYNCNNLKDVYFTGTEAQWKNIDISWSNDNLTSANIHYNKTAPTPTPTPTPTYTIKYDANGGSGAPSNQSAKSGTTITVSSQIPKRTGYDFLGWSASKTAETAIYNAGDSITITSNRTLYAVWSKIPMPDTTGNEITISDAEINDNVVSFTLELVTTHTMQGTILVGVYDDNGTLVNIMSYPAKESNDISFTKQDNDSTVKVFWWYDSDIIFPMAKNAELALTDENAV